ncbi:hypothetical protein [Nitrobacter sp. JJSN]|uniref:hypothetical protein n=1 Tax=Nitrobacter sp. JJSN TaxID=3453033 RepID=UPI003F75A181
MPQAARTSTTKPSAKRQRAAPVAVSANASIDPVVERGRFLRDLWDAHDAVESEAFAARRNDDPSLGIQRDEQAHQILDWKDLVEAEISFLVANSLRGALIQLALMQDAMNDLNARIENSDCDSAREVAIKIGRLLRSASDAVHDAMGEDQYAEVSGIVSTYASVGDDHPNFLLDMPAWMDKGSDRRCKRDLAKVEVAA